MRTLFSGRIRRVGGWVGLAFGLVVAAPAADAADLRLGAGVHYWRTTDAPDMGGVQRSGRSEYLTVQMRFLPLLKGQLDLERFPKKFAGSPQPVFSPQALIVVGGWLYGAAGIGMLYADGRFSERPYYQLRAGIEMPVLPRVRLDAHARYHLSEWDRINRLARDFESDLWSLSAGVRIVF